MRCTTIEKRSETTGFTTNDRMNKTRNCVNLSPGKSMKNHTADLVEMKEWKRSVKMIYDGAKLTVLYTSIHKMCAMG